MSVKILAVGDVCGEPGLDFLGKRLKDYRKENEIDFVVVNGENANVVGITPRQADLIFRAGADVITLGNHMIKADLDIAQKAKAELEKQAAAAPKEEKAE